MVKVFLVSPEVVVVYPSISNLHIWWGKYEKLINYANMQIRWVGKLNKPKMLGLIFEAIIFNAEILGQRDLAF